MLLQRVSLSASLLACVSAPAGDFPRDPCAEGGGWVCGGQALWVSPDAEECPEEDPDFFNPWFDLDPSNPCTLYPGEGYVIVTPAAGDRGGSFFRSEPFRFEHFRLTAEFELRDGSIQRPGDGMAIIIVGGTAPPGAPGTLGGGLGAAGLGAVPTFIIEIDNWSGDCCDGGDDNHIALTWSPSGFPALDRTCAPRLAPGCNDVMASVDRAKYPLNNRQPHPAVPNRFRLEVVMLAGTMTAHLENEDAGMPRTLLFEYEVPGFAPFDGFLGATASVGGIWQNSIIHSLDVERLEVPRFRRGDADGSGTIEITDAIEILGSLFLWCCLVPPCTDAQDTDDNGAVNISDAVGVLNWLFLGAGDPPAPGPRVCGEDPSPDELSDCVYERC